ncbi:MAG: spermidine synthase [Candidatus Rokuibacteriota bacterium]
MGGDGSRGASPARLAFTLFCLGFLGLFLELTLIRYLGGNVWNLGYFPNLVLVAAFVGLGIGFVFHPAVSPRGSSWLFQGAAVALAILVSVVSVKRPIVPGFDQWEGVIGGELYFTATPVKSSDASLWLFVFWFVAVVVVFAFVAQRTAKIFRLIPPLRAYTLDIAGSLAGILAFMLVSWWELPAYAWFILLIPVFLAGSDAIAQPRTWIAVLALALVVVLAHRQDQRLMGNPEFGGRFETFWSPYQKVEYVPPPVIPARIFVNGIAHQRLNTGEQIRAAFYQAPHDHRRRAGRPPYRTVLVIGAGAGNDLASALANGAEHVDAVEIDPVIARLGGLHPARPYADGRVSLTIDDARAVLTRAERRYDLILFALTDSLVKVSAMAQLRLENYLFTEESIRRAYGLLADGGDIVLYNYYRRPWILERFQQMIHAATGKYPLALVREGDFHMFLVGRANGASEAPPFPSGRLDIPTDDWPFPYLKQRGIPAVYLWALAGLGGLVVGLMVLFERLSRQPSAAAEPRAWRMKWAFLFMGVAFLLLETKSIVQFSLLFGTTWLNTSLVVLAVLTLVLTANWTAGLLRGPWALHGAYLLLLASCLVTIVYPLGNLLALEATTRFLVASLMTFSPIFFANLIFSLTFRDQAVPEQLFGWNLLGATVGGIVEYASMAIGYNALAVIVAICYTAVFALLLARRSPPARAAA